MSWVSRPEQAEPLCRGLSASRVRHMRDPVWLAQQLAKDGDAYLHGAGLAEDAAGDSWIGGRPR